MPVKILDDRTGMTSIPNGSIKISDLQKMIINYRQNVIITASVNGSNIVPKHSFYFTKTQLMDLLESNDTADAIEITLGIQLPGSIVLCNNGAVTTDTSNSMVAILSSAKKDDLSSFNNIGDEVLINGYKSASLGAATNDCCPNTKP